MGTRCKRKHLLSNAFMDCTHVGKRNIKPTVNAGSEQVPGDHPGNPCMAQYTSDCQSFVPKVNVFCLFVLLFV